MHKAILCHILEELGHLTKGLATLDLVETHGTFSIWGCLRSLLVGVCGYKNIIVIVIRRHHDDVSSQVPRIY